MYLKKTEGSLQEECQWSQAVARTYLGTDCYTQQMTKWDLNVRDNGKRLSQEKQDKE